MIYLIRHGQTEFNVERRIQGNGDSPLTALGRDQARRVGLGLGRAIGDGDAVIFASPLGRTRATARIIADASGISEDRIVFDDDLKEIHMGQWEGLTTGQIARGWPDFPSRDHLEWHFTAPDGESFEQMAERLDRALARVAAHPARHRVIISHGVSGRIMRGLHAKLPRHETLALDIPQDAYFVLGQDGIRRIDCLED